MGMVWNTQMERKSAKKGFTLVELSAALLIITLLTAIAIPPLSHWRKQTREQQVLMEGREAYLAAQNLALEEYAKLQPRDPESEEFLKAVNQFAGTDGEVIAITFETDYDALELTQRMYEVETITFRSGDVTAVYTSSGDWEIY